MDEVNFSTISMLAELLPAEIQDLPVTGVAFSTRTRNALLNGNVRRVGELASKTHAELFAMRGFGESTYRDIHEVLTHLLGGEDSVARLATLSRGVATSGDSVSMARWSADSELPVLLNDFPQALLEIRVERLSLPVRVAGVLTALGVNVVGDLKGYTRAKLMRQRKFGAGSYKALISILERLRDDPQAALREWGHLFELLEVEIEAVPEKNRKAIIHCSGWNTQRMGADDVARVLGVTRQRIDQIRHQFVLSVESRHDLGDRIHEKLQRLQRTLNRPLRVDELATHDEFFVDVEHRLDTFRWVLRSFLPGAWHVCLADNDVGHFVTRLKPIEVTRLIAAAARILRSAHVEMRPLDAEYQRIVELVPAYASELTSAITTLAEARAKSAYRR